MTSKDAMQPPRNAGEMMRMAREFLARKGVVEARLEGELLVAHALALTRLELFMQLDRPVSSPEIDRARDLLVRRGRREPVAYITGQREFYGRPFKVGPGVLIPRPETELIIDRAREIASPRASVLARELPSVDPARDLAREPSSADPAREREPQHSFLCADIGTGSGCIAVTLALEIEGATVVAIDISPAAVLCAQTNAQALGARIETLEGDGLATLAKLAAERRLAFDLIASNPPYIAREERPTLAPEVREHEPEVALFAPDGDPDHFLGRLLQESRVLLAPGGALLVELGEKQAPRALDLARAQGWQARTHRDIAGIERVLEANP